MSKAKHISKPTELSEYIEKFNKLKADRDRLLEACKAWMKVESEMGDNHPCPDYTLRTQYRKEAVRLTAIAIAESEKTPD